MPDLGYGDVSGLSPELLSEPPTLQGLLAQGDSNLIPWLFRRGANLTPIGRIVNAARGVLGSDVANTGEFTPAEPNFVRPEPGGGGPAEPPFPPGGGGGGGGGGSGGGGGGSAFPPGRGWGSNPAGPVLRTATNSIPPIPLGGGGSSPQGPPIPPHFTNTTNIGPETYGPGAFTQPQHPPSTGRMPASGSTTTRAPSARSPAQIVAAQPTGGYYRAGLGTGRGAQWVPSSQTAPPIYRGPLSLYS